MHVPKHFCPSITYSSFITLSFVKSDSFLPLTTYVNFSLSTDTVSLSNFLNIQRLHQPSQLTTNYQRPTSLVFHQLLSPSCLPSLSSHSSWTWIIFIPNIQRYLKVLCRFRCFDLFYDIDIQPFPTHFRTISRQGSLNEFFKSNEQK